MKYQRHWATSTVLPDGDVLVTGGGRENNGDGGYVTNAEIWDPETGRLDRGRGAVRARPALPLHGPAPARRPRDDRRRRRSRPAQLHRRRVLLPVVPVRRRRSRPRARRSPPRPRRSATTAPSSVSASGDVSRVTLVRNGSVTHGFNNDQNFQDLAFSQTGSARSPSPRRRTAPTPLPARTCCSSSTPTAPRRSRRSWTSTPRWPMDAADPAGRRPVRVPAPARRLARRQPAPRPSTSPRATAGWRRGPSTARSSSCAAPPPARAASASPATSSPWAARAASSARSRASTPGRDYRISLRYARDSRSAGTPPRPPRCRSVT